MVAAVALCLLCFGVQMADLVTTIRAVTLPGGVEVMTLPRWILANAGVIGFFVFKLDAAVFGTLAGWGGLALLAHDDDRQVRLFALTLVLTVLLCNVFGMLVVAHNVQIIALLLSHIAHNGKR